MSADMKGEPADSDEPQSFPERRRLYEEGLNDREIAERVESSRRTIASWRNKRGLPPNYSSSSPQEKGLQDLSYDFPDWVHEFIGELSPARREKVLSFLREMELSGKKRTTVQRYVRAIEKLGTAGKPYEDLGEDDLIEWMRSLPAMKEEGEGEYGDQTVNLIKRLCKRFLRFCHTGELNADKTEDYPEALDCIQYQQPNSKLPKEILTKEEVKKIVEACQNQRNRAMILTLYESGCRRGEFLSLKIGDVEPDQHGAVMMVDGKTGPRRIRLVEAAPELQLWLNMHPHKNDREAPVWVSRNGEKKALTGTQLGELIKQRAKKAGIDKNVYPHLFRHSRATHLANVLTEAQMREYFGWSENSDVPSRYVHLSGRDVDDTLLQHYGVEEKEEDTDRKSLKPQPCPRCGFKNPVGSQFGNKCGMALGDEVAQKIDKKREHADEIQKMFNEWILENGKELFKEFMQRSEVQEEIKQIQYNHVRDANAET